MRKKVAKVSFIVSLILTLDCNLLQQRIEERKNVSRFNRRLVFPEKVPESCSKELAVQFSRQQNKTLAEAKSAGCVLLFRWHDTFDRIVLTDWVLLGMQQAYSWQGENLLASADVGWGFRLAGQITIENTSYPFQIFISKADRKQYADF